MSRSVFRGNTETTRAVVGWYVQRGHDQSEPFYCDPARVGAFAIAPRELAAGTDNAIFRLFVGLSMYQALRDVVIMRRQHSLTAASMRIVADLESLRRSISRHECPKLRSAEEFEVGCDVQKRRNVVDCGTCPGVACHVKKGTVVFNRMGDMGKLPTSAWLRVWKPGGVRKLLAEVCREESAPTKRAILLVERFARVHRVGRKLATMFVSALSTPALAPGLTPWFPRVDGNDLVVVDTNVARAVDTLRPAGEPKTYDARERWVRLQATAIDLREFRADFPAYSARVVQQALYAYCSLSNRRAAGDECSQEHAACASCVKALCPFPAIARRKRVAADSKFGAATEGARDVCGMD